MLIIECKKSKKTDRLYYALSYVKENNFKVLITFDQNVLLKLVDIPTLGAMKEGDTITL